MWRTAMSAAGLQACEEARQVEAGEVGRQARSTPMPATLRVIMSAKERPAARPSASRMARSSSAGP